MRLFGFLFAPKNTNSPDVLGAYPEYMQVKALPERRYMKTSHFLAVIIIINIALTILIASFVIYPLPIDVPLIYIPSIRLVKSFCPQNMKK